MGVTTVPPITIAYRHLGGGRFAIGDRTIRLIEGGDVVPGFTCSVAAFFEGVPRD